MLPGFHNPHRYLGHLWKKLELPLHSQDVSQHHSALPILLFGAAETGQWNVCIEHWNSSEISKTISRRNLQSPTNALIKSKAWHHSPPMGTSPIYIDDLVISFTKADIWQRTTKQAASFQREQLQVKLVSQGDDFSSTQSISDKRKKPIFPRLLPP